MSENERNRDFRDTVTTPETAFPMRGNLPTREPEWLAHWEKMDLFNRLREESAGRPKFVLHDGPPYANGNLHIGHALNKILKDVINRSHQMLGKDAHYVPGWDCHGLPIEWKIEEQYRERGQDKDEVDVVEFRRECRDFAQGWVEEQTRQFKRLGVLGNWDQPYLTMHYDAEAQIVRELGKFLLDGQLYKGNKPVLWSVVEKTALADAEVEYYPHKSVTIWVKFPVKSAPQPELVGASAVIWTTTTWTIPGNRAMAFHDDIAYGVYRVDAVAEGSLAQVGERLIIADETAEATAASAKIEAWTREDLKVDLTGVITAHPLAEQGFDHAVPMFHGDYVTTEQGTGLVHIAPGHGFDDWQLATVQHGVEVPMTVAEDGAFYDHVPLFCGLTVYDQKGKDGTALGPILRALIEAGGLLAKGKLEHSYPHSWRSKAPLIFRNTAQWFISMEEKGLRAGALKALGDTGFVPEQGRNRITSMIESRPDWCVSRQRVWGVPLPIFVRKSDGQPLRDPKVIERIAEAYELEGGDAWFNSPPSRFLGNDYDPDDFEQGRDVVEVWFDSGATHSFVLEKRPELKWPADLYLEGSDQHRGWFHSSLLVGVGTRDRAPYDAILTHGFVLDEKGNKMSKSLGNVTAPDDVAKDFGIDILRLWVVASDYSDDLRIGPAILKHSADAYRRFRNSLRFILGNLGDFQPSQSVAYDDLPELERWVLHRLSELDALVRTSAEAYDFHRLYTELHNFCAVDLSALYFDIRKDALYCDAPDSLRARAARTVLAECFSCLTAWLAPILCFTAEEAWLTRREDEAELPEKLVDTDSVHLRVIPEIPVQWSNAALADKWADVFAVRRVITTALEPMRQEKTIGSSLQAAPRVFLSPDKAAALADVDFTEVAIVSGVTIETGEGPADAVRVEDIAGVAVTPQLAAGEKCQRCWQVLPEVSTHPDHLCARCDVAVAGTGA
ncbi:MAG: isoleucine--tRNA ligase [Alphaproteobacteria bacterium]|nr:isoleucine--tRNA ligase [Alphaproteobacteria bacterium]